jgi:hypothetical protein
MGKLSALFYFFVFFNTNVLHSQDAFISVWDLSIGMNSTGIVFYADIQGGDAPYVWQEVSPGNASGSGIFFEGDSLREIVNLPENATIQLSIEGQHLKRFYTNINNVSWHQPPLVAVTQWGSAQWISFESMFDNCFNLTSIPAGLPHMTGVTSCAYMFKNCYRFGGVAEMNNWKTDSVNDMSEILKSY